MNISFIGYGNMAQALSKGLKLNPLNKIRAAAPSLPTGFNKEGIQTSADNLAVIPDADVLILAVKPAQISAILNQIKTVKLPETCLILSIASGLSLAFFESYLPKAPIVRAMPNIAAAIGKGATPLIANAFVTTHQKQWAEDIFTSTGIITWAHHDNEIDAFTAFSGSGPAYVFLFLEALIAAGIHLGIKADIAQSFAIQTVQGALSLANESTLTLSELRKTVTSPAGTTAAAIKVFTANHFDEIIHQATQAAFLRAQELGQN